MRRLLLILVISAPGAWSLAQKPRLYVFMPSPIRPHAMQSRLTSSFPQWEVIVFGRFKEFERQIKTATPNAILTLPVVAQQFEAFHIWLQGTRGGKAEEPCVLLSVNQAIKPSNQITNPIGIVDLLGRRKMEIFLSRKLAVERVRVRTVTKLEDLLSLLQFQDVDAIFVPKSMVNYYLERSRLNLIVNDLSKATIGLPILAVHVDTVSDKATRIEDFLKLDDKLKKLLGVDIWQRP